MSLWYVANCIQDEDLNKTTALQPLFMLPVLMIHLIARPQEPRTSFN